ncbi:uncharacterized protein [Amphiura filiformis]|uniref:uncharacterized protein isoform X2 n=1 Tax=Amphiura filiformis TaxID=82378 RepID=UPI003B211CFE
MPKIKTVSQGAPTRQSPRAKKARLEAEKEADKEELQEKNARKPSLKPQRNNQVKPSSSSKGISAEKSSANLAIYMKSLAADYEAKMAAKKREEYIKNFLARPSEAQLQAQRQQAYAEYINQISVQSMMRNPTPFQTLASPASTINLTKAPTPVAVVKVDDAPAKSGSSSVADQNSAPKTTSENSSSQKTSSSEKPANSEKKSGGKSGNGDKMIMEFETGYKCMRCLEFYESRAELKHHIIKVHTDMLNFKCGKCGEVFSKQEKLEKHERTHGRDKTYVCIHCDTSFYGLENLQRHEKIHEKKTEYKCSGCTRTYTDIEKLVMHERIHKKAELPFQCEECDEGFRARGNLKMHIRAMHTPKGKKK